MEPSPPLDAIWGTIAIAATINRSPRQTYHLLESGRLPARKVGGRWVASREKLKQFLAGVDAEVAAA